MISNFRQLLLTLLAGTLCVTPIVTQSAVTDLHVISLKHRLAEEVVPAVRPLLAPGESVSTMDSRLIVRATPETLIQIKQLLVEIDTPRRNLRISVRHAGEVERVQESRGIAGNVNHGNTRIIVSNSNRNNDGVTIGRAGTIGTVQVHNERRVTANHGTSNQNLMVLDGGHAFLRVGESIPQVQPYLILVQNRPGFVTGIQYYDVTTGFEVEPRIVGEKIRIAVTPRLAFRSSQGLQTIYFQELQSVVTVSPGEWIDLGGTVESDSKVHRQILSTQDLTGKTSSRFLIRVDPQ